MARSRRAANELAEARLALPRTIDEDILAVLQRWYFKHNTTRKNVLPEGVTSIQSDTLGVVRTRTGSVVLTRLTKKSPAVFHLFCRWLKQNCPAIYKIPFPFTSISVNYGYAARKHRDGYNAGPSVLKTFGEFTGGNLLYWPDDDGQEDVRALSESRARCFDAKREMLLFDGLRCHCVAPFEGERYSLVFFTASEYQKVQAATIEFLGNLDVVWPTDESVGYFRSLLSPPTGTSKNIRLMFNYEEKPGAIQCGGTSLLKLRDAVPIVLSFVLVPEDMPILCALSSGIKARAQDQQSWSGSTVDARHVKPRGVKAHGHWQAWSRAKHVVAGDWAHGNVGLLVSPSFSVWRWVQANGCRHLRLRGHTISISQTPVPMRTTLLLQRLDEAVLVGLANTRQPKAILSTVLQTGKKCCFLGVAITPLGAQLFKKITR